MTNATMTAKTNIPKTGAEVSVAYILSRIQSLTPSEKMALMQFVESLPSHSKL